MAVVKKRAFVSPECVACGCCVIVCPLKAITVYKGIRAIVNEKTCVGCGKCAKACPAEVIEIEEVRKIEEAVV